MCWAVWQAVSLALMPSRLLAGSAPSAPGGKACSGPSWPGLARCGGWHGPARGGGRLRSLAKLVGVSAEVVTAAPAALAALTAAAAAEAGGAVGLAGARAVTAAAVAALAALTAAAAAEAGAAVRMAGARAAIAAVRMAGARAALAALAAAAGAAVRVARSGRDSLKRELKVPTVRSVKFCSITAVEEADLVVAISRMVSGGAAG
eukprot:scaffold28355_cov57-Phaeocystis_antarctica.AAC.2